MDPYGYMRKASKGRGYVWKRSDKQESSSRIGVSGWRDTRRLNAKGKASRGTNNGRVTKTKKEACNERPKGRSSEISPSVFPNKTGRANQEGAGEERF
jgi:hypothetical protein